MLGLSSTPLEAYQAWFESLTPEEQQRASQYRSRKRYQHFLSGRELLKSLLEYRLGVRQPRIELGSNGEPKIVQPDLFCSISHSHDAVLVAYSQHCKIGVDIEKLRSRNFVNLVEAYFHPKELEEFQSLNEYDYERWFYKHWTGKEAFAKKTGKGITLSGLSQLIPTARDDVTYFEMHDYACAVAATGSIDLFSGKYNNGKIEFSTI